MCLTAPLFYIIHKLMHGLRQPPLLKGHQLMTSWGKITQHIPNINTLDDGGAIKLLSAATKATFFPVFAFIKMFHIKWLTATDIKFIPWKIKAVAHIEKINMQWWIITWMNLSAGNVNDMQSLNCLCVIMYILPSLNDPFPVNHEVIAAVTLVIVRFKIRGKAQVETLLPPHVG